jgi:CRP-like cAMP-binding protein
VEVINRDVLSKVPLFEATKPVFLQNLSMMLKPKSCLPGDFIIRMGDTGREMYFISRGQVEILDGDGKRLNTLADGDFFGELSLLRSQRRMASVRALSPCDLFVLDQQDFQGVLRNYSEFAGSLHEAALSRYQAVEGTS